MNALIANKIKAIAGAVVAALVAYIGTAITTDNGLTAHGLELAAVGAVLTFLGVHQAPANKPKPAKKRTRRHPADRGAASGIVVLVIAVCILAVFLGVAVNHLWLLLLLVLILLVL